MNRQGAALIVPFIVFLIGGAGGQSQRVKTIDLAGADGRSVMTLAVSDSAILVETQDHGAVALLTSEAVTEINPLEKTYQAYRYDEIQALIDKRLEDAGTTPAGTDAGPEVEFKATDVVADIAGCSSRKVVKLNHGKPESEIWVCSGLMPAGLRTINEKMRAIFTADYWKKVHGNPGMLEVVLLYGIPMKVSVDGQDVLQTRVSDGVRPAASFQVPQGYRRVGRE